MGRLGLSAAQMQLGPAATVAPARSGPLVVVDQIRSWQSRAGPGHWVRLTHLTPRLRDSRNCAACAAANSGPPPSKRNFGLHVAALAGAGHRRRALARRGTGRSEIAATHIVGADFATASARTVQHGELRVEALQHDLGRVFVLPRLILPFARLQRTLEINLRALLQVLLGDPAKSFVEDDDAVPFGLFFPLAGRLVAPGLRRGHAQIRDRAPVLRTPDLGILAEIADEDHLVHATGHDALLLIAFVTLIPSPRTSRRRTPSCHAFPQHVGSRSRCRVMFSVCSNRALPQMQCARTAFSNQWTAVPPVAVASRRCSHRNMNPMIGTKMSL